MTDQWSKGWGEAQIESDEGFTTIVTPDFTYGVYLDIDEEDPRQYVLVKSISEIQNPEIIADERFYNIFDGCFDTVEIALEKPIKVEDLIDMIEERDAFPVDYPSDASYCSISLNGHGLTIRFEMDKIIPKSSGGVSLKPSSAETGRRLTPKMVRMGTA